MTVKCHEAYAVGIRLCPSCEKKIGYLAEVAKKNTEMQETQEGWLSLNGYESPHSVTTLAFAMTIQQKASELKESLETFKIKNTKKVG